MKSDNAFENFPVFSSKVQVKILFKKKFISSQMQTLDSILCKNNNTVISVLRYGSVQIQTHIPSLVLKWQAQSRILPETMSSYTLWERGM